MEQFLYTYLNQKYGLKSLVINQINSMIAAIQKYQFQDIEVLLFGKVLRHEVNEEFRRNVTALTDRLDNLILQQIMEKNPMKGKNYVNAVYLNIKTDKMPIDYLVWNKILFVMHEQMDAMLIEDRLKQQKLAAQMEKQFASKHEQSTKVDNSKRSGGFRARNKSVNLWAGRNSHQGPLSNCKN